MGQVCFLIGYQGKKDEFSLSFLQYYVCVFSHSVLLDSMDCSPPGSSVNGNFPGKNTGVGCHFFLQGIFPTQGLNQYLLCLLPWLVDSLPLPISTYTLIQF